MGFLRCEVHPNTKNLYKVINLAAAKKKSRQRYKIKIKFKDPLVSRGDRDGKRTKLKEFQGEGEYESSRQPVENDKPSKVQEML